MSDSPQVWDPLRKKMVSLTPEERVRQWFIGVLRDVMGVPEYMMKSEVGMKFGEGPAKKEYRADILVFDRSGKPLLVAECKRPEVELSQEVINQALRYNMVLDVTYIVITNGKNSYICKRNGNSFDFLDKAPTWEEMLSI
jgi:type I site-specific restriction endonuclease